MCSHADALAMRMEASATSACVGTTITLTISIVDRFGNEVSAPHLSGDLLLEEAEGRACSGIGNLRLDNGKLTTEVGTEVASSLQLRVMTALDLLTTSTLTTKPSMKSSRA